MFKYKPTEEEIELNKQITYIHTHMDAYPPTSPEYKAMTDHLVKLYEQKKTHPSTRISPDAKAAMIANLLGIGIITFHERAYVIAGKAITFVKKLKD